MNIRNGKNYRNLSLRFMHLKASFVVKVKNTSKKQKTTLTETKRGYNMQSHKPIRRKNDGIHH
uniref:Uncharacterized protein n=1 Tax=Salmonella phage PMBT35 TaxID=3137287 RepID=A0AAU8BVR1_9VIRU